MLNTKPVQILFDSSTVEKKTFLCYPTNRDAQELFPFPRCAVITCRSDPLVRPRTVSMESGSLSFFRNSAIHKYRFHPLFLSRSNKRWMAELFVLSRHSLFFINRSFPVGWQVHSGNQGRCIPAERFGYTSDNLSFVPCASSGPRSGCKALRGGANARTRRACLVG